MHEKEGEGDRKRANKKRDANEIAHSLARSTHTLARARTNIAKYIKVKKIQRQREKRDSAKRNKATVYGMHTVYTVCIYVW